MPHNTMDRVTLRLPDRLIARADALVDTGEYPNRSEVFRDGAREVFARYDFSDGEPKRHGPTDAPQPAMIMAKSSGNDNRAAALSRIYTLRSLTDDEPFIVFDAGGALNANTLPDDVVVARDATELRKAIREIDA